MITASPITTRRIGQNQAPELRSDVDQLLRCLWDQKQEPDSGEYQAGNERDGVESMSLHWSFPFAQPRVISMLPRST